MKHFSLQNSQTSSMQLNPLGCRLPEGYFKPSNPKYSPFRPYQLFTLTYLSGFHLTTFPQRPLMCFIQIKGHILLVFTFIRVFWFVSSKYVHAWMLKNTLTSSQSLRLKFSFLWLGPEKLLWLARWKMAIIICGTFENQRASQRKLIKKSVIIFKRKKGK